MKIQGGGSNNPVDLKQIKAQREVRAEAQKEVVSTGSDQVEARLSQTLSAIEAAISESGLTAAELHSNVDEPRARALLDSFDRVGESKRPRLDDEAVLDIAERISQSMFDSPQKAVSAFGEVNRARVEELLST